jgi:wyosine [tRNA(Phe)-imidazoG37] synthetase (radical SAM superfamily)
MLTFGPVPSRRIGRSLGINNIPPKNCSYACVYCQVGSTTRMGIERKSFYPPEEIIAAVREKVEQASAADTAIDYLTFVPDGEPTLDIHLGEEIQGLKHLGPKIAVISNASLIWDPNVQSTLAQADWVSLKFDAVSTDTWKKIDRPHGKLSLESIMDGARAFVSNYKGRLVTETMLVRGINDDADNLRATAAFVAGLKPAAAYISMPTRPPVETWVEAPESEVMHRAYRIFNEHVENVEYLVSYEGTDFHVTDNVEADLLDITAVHPMREDAVAVFLKKAGAEYRVVEQLVDAGMLARLTYQGETFYVRKFKRRTGD